MTGLQFRPVFEDLTVEENLIAGGHTNKSRTKMKQDMGIVYDYFPRLKDR
ncbi:MAG: ABC transporter ATP-binding protein, partial [Deltaproteobacteria bacterium]|nr:ABC transporter ATP-binding protein [Deltaproteobacteria bacterium]